MIRRAVHTRTFVSATLLTVAMPLAPVSIAAQQSGVEFDVKTVMSVSGGMSGVLGGMTPGYSGHGFALGKRLRIDIVDGALPPLADKGDYMLFDSTGITVVHPSKKEFVPFPLDFPNKALEQIQAMGMTITLGDMAFRFDTLPGVDTIAGYPTRHYKQTIGYTITMDGMGVSQQMKSQATNEYWMAMVPGLGLSPLQQAGQVGGGMQSMSALPQFKELAVKIDSVSRRMTGSAVRVRATTNSDTGGAGTVGLDMTSEMSNLKRVMMAETLFVVPSDYVRGASPFPSGN
jgi:hypothetical protein